MVFDSQLIVTTSRPLVQCGQSIFTIRYCGIPLKNGNDPFVKLTMYPNFCPVWLKFCSMVLKKKRFKCDEGIFTNSLLSYLERGCDLFKESGRIRRRFDRNVGIYKKGWKIIDDSYDSFNSILDYRKIIKILPKCILVLQDMILNRAIRSISYDNRQILLCF